MKIGIGQKGLDMSNIWVAIICISLLELIALLKGINGILLRVVIGTIAALAGLATPAEKILKKIKGMM